MFSRTMCSVIFASVCIILASEIGVLQAENPRNSSTSQVTDSVQISSLEKGMDVLYDITNGFLDTVQNQRIYDQTWLNLSAVASGTYNFDSSKWQEITNYGLGFSLCLVAGLLFTVVMPIVGCCFCCCRLCGKCGGKRKLRDPKHAKCKRNSYCTVLLIMNTICLAGVVCAFVTNDILYRKFQNEDNQGPVGNINKALTTIQTYVNETVDFLKKTTIGEFDSARLEIMNEINNTADTAVDEVLKIVNASSYLDKARALGDKTEIVLTDLNNIQVALDNLKTGGENLTTELTNLKMEIQAACNISSNDCSTLLLDQYKTDANFSHLSDLSGEIDSVKKSLNISTYIKEAEDKIREVKTNSTDVIKSSITDATNTMKNVRADVVSGIDQYKSSIITYTDPLSSFKKTINDGQKNIKDYSAYIWYAGIGISCVFLLIVLFYYLGVLFGTCGERPGHGAACCNTSVGGNFLIAGVAFSFIFSWILMIICFVMFLPGGLVYTELCRYLISHDPSQLKPFDDLIFKNLDVTKEVFNKSNNFSFVLILEDCEKNKAIYTALQLDNVINLDTVVNLSLVDKELDKIYGSNVNFDNITILTPNLENELKQFRDSGLENINYAAFETEIKKNITAVDLKELSAMITAYIQAGTGTQRDVFKPFATKLTDLDSYVVNPMKLDVGKLELNLNQLKQNSDVKNETDDLISGLRSAEAEFHTKGVQLVNSMIKNVATSIKATVKAKTEKVKDLVKNDAGKCRPIFDALYLLTDSACVMLLSPLNGFWFSMGWCLFFFIPSIIFAVKLSTLYRREEEYVHEKQFDEANFSMYAGPNPDTIPLTSSGSQHAGGNGAHNTGYRDDGYKGKSSNNGYPTHADSPPAYDERYRGERNGNKRGEPYRY